MAGNQAVSINSADVGIALTEHGSDWLWAVFAVLALNAIVHAALTLYNFHRGEKGVSYLHVGPLCASATLAYAYFTTASNLGWAGVPVEFNHITIGDDERQIFYARYIGWFLAFPSVLYLFELNAAAQHVLASYNFVEVFHHLILQLTSTWVFVLGLLIGSLIKSSYKWGYWTFAASALLFALALLLHRQLFSDVRATTALNSIALAFYTVCLILYPVAWGLSEGGNVIQPDSEAVFYGVLDLIVFWIIPWVVVIDGTKNGTFIDGVSSTAIPRHDVEKNLNSPPELRHSGETAAHDAPAQQTEAQA
ncbi:CYFA0S12e02674g1_1 [Cyberlindnera fabianii]|uniref:30 kDa heat shock protein n=1 Tax=Cyberlindnera fabianii TaxID=36022 RepID=A0A061B1F4_CYBFA|nr:30 kDa heat shock protein [Cyberlindnera fabianii]CDR43625.1 CYFA0S12e02674g1_1 [Cyberlindnera fabianii]